MIKGIIPAKDFTKPADPILNDIDVNPPVPEQALQVYRSPFPNTRKPSAIPAPTKPQFQVVNLSRKPNSTIKKMSMIDRSKYEHHMFTKYQEDKKSSSRIFVVDAIWINSWLSFTEGKGALPGEINNQLLKTKLIDDDNREKLAKNTHYFYLTL